MSQLCCNVDYMADLASSVYPLVSYLACLIVVTQYIGGTADASAAGLGEAHADVDIKVLKLETDAAYTNFLQRKLVEWYKAAPKSDCYAPAQVSGE